MTFIRLTLDVRLSFSYDTSSDILIDQFTIRVSHHLFASSMRKLHDIQNEYKSKIVKEVNVQGDLHTK